MLKTKYPDLTFVSRSDEKAAEYRSILEIPQLRHCKEDFDEFQDLYLEKIVIAKINQVKARGNVAPPFFVEHTELRIDSWGRLPGGLTRHFMEQVGPAGICKMMTAYKGNERIARLRTVIGYCPIDGSPHTIEGTAVGTIALEPHFGPDFAWDFDQIFIPDGDTRTYAQMGKDEKNQISMRREAARKLLNEYLLRYSEVPGKRKTGSGSGKQRKPNSDSRVQQSAMPRLLTANGEKNFVGAAPTLIQELGQKLRGGNVAVFAGAQFSVGAGLPGWYELVREIARQVDYQLPPEEYTLSDHLIDAVQAFVGRRGLHSLLGLLKDRFDTTGKLPCTASQILARLPINLVFTTNLDDMLERSFREANRRVEAVVEDASLAFAPHDPDIVTIVKLGGDLAQPSSIVLARQQFDTFFQTRRRMIEFVKTELERSDMLCLGWSLPDPYFRLVFGDLLGLPGEFARPKYALVTQVSESQRRELERKGVYLIKIPPGDHGEYLTHWLSELAEAAKS